MTPVKNKMTSPIIDNPSIDNFLSELNTLANNVFFRTEIYPNPFVSSAVIYFNDFYVAIINELTEKYFNTKSVFWIYI